MDTVPEPGPGLPPRPGEGSRRVRELFWSTCDLSPAERARRLAQACRHQPRVREEVESLLASHDASSQFLGRPAAEEHAPWFAAHETRRAPAAVVPERVGPYRILDRIAEGGMGEVYLAEQEAPLHRQVALKVVKQGMRSRDVVARFESERLALAMMSHSHIARVYEAGTGPDGRPYFVMEHVPGEPVHRHSDRHRLGVHARIELITRVCEAIQHAHQKGVVHSDVKPSNVLVAMEEGRAVPKVIDFGIAKALDRRPAQESLPGGTGILTGTPEYMSPEQAAAEEGEIDTRTDIYSLGVLLYELLTGVLPFGDHALRGAPLAHVLRVIREEEPPPPSVRFGELARDERRRLASSRSTKPASLERRLRGDLDSIVGRAMAKEPSRRYSSASELAEDLRRYLRGDAVLARSPTPIDRMSRFLCRHRAAAAAFVGVVAALTLGLAVSLHQYFRADSARIAAQDAAARTGRALAQKEAALAKSEGLRLAAQARELIPNRLDVSLALALRAGRLHPGRHANNVLLDALDRFTPHRILGRGKRWFVAAAVSPDARTVAATSIEGTVWLWDRASRTRQSVLAHPGVASAPSFRPDGRRLVTAGRAVAQVWDVATAERTATLRGHEGYVYLARYGPEGKRLATASFDSTARIWDPEIPELVHILPGHGGRIIRLAFHRDGSRLLTLAKDRTARVWDVASGRLVASLCGHSAHVDDARFDPEGERVVTASHDGTAIVWDIATGSRTVVIPSSGSGLLHAAFTPDGRRVVTAAHDGSIGLWDAAGGTRRGLLEGHTGPVTSVAFDPSGRRLLTASYDKTARVWDLASGRQALVARGHEGRVNDAVFTPDGRHLVTASFDGTVRLWATRGALRPLGLEAHRAGVERARFRSDGRRLVTASRDGTARVCDLETGREVARLAHGNAAVTDGVFDPEGGRVLTACSDHVVRLWDAERGSLLSRLEGHTGTVYRARFLPGGGRAVTISGDSTVRIWDLATGRTVHLFRGHDGRVVHLRVGPRGRRVATAGAGGSALVWDVKRGHLVRRLGGAPHQVAAIDLDPEARRIATASWDGTACLWDIGTGRRLAVLAGHEARVVDVAFSPDGRRLVTGSWDSTARLWDVDTGAEVALLRGHEDAVKSVAYGPRGRWVATASSDAKVRVWDARSGEPSMAFAGDGRKAPSVGFGPRGRRIVAAWGDGAVRCWPLAPASLAARLLPRQLTAAEREEFAIGARVGGGGQETTRDVHGRQQPSCP